MIDKKTAKKYKRLLILLKKEDDKLKVKDSINYYITQEDLDDPAIIERLRTEVLPSIYKGRTDLIEPALRTLHQEGYVNLAVEGKGTVAPPAAKPAS